MDGSGKVDTRNYRGAAALVLAASTAVCVIVLSIGAAVQAGPISQEDATLLSTVLGAAVGAVATYLGGRGPNPPSSPSSGA